MGTRPTGPEIAKLVEKQMRNWELSRAQRAAGPGGQGGTGTAQRVAPFVAISRSVEAGGSEVARELGEALGWPVFDREILQAMAGDNEVRARLYENMDERDKSWIEDALKWLLRGRVPPEDYYYRVTEAVLAIQRQGPAVFLGRGADLILPKELGLRVRLDAPLEHRARVCAAREHVSEAEALTRIAQVDRERADFRRRHFGRAANEVTAYDMLFNTERLAREEIVELIVTALRRRGLIP